jgi:LAO/AO transport system kinase
VFQHHGKLEVVEAPDEPLYNSWIPPIQKTVATEGTGISELVDEIARHAEHLRESGDWAARERSRLGAELDALLQERLVARFREQVSESRYEAVLDQIFQRELAPWEAVKELLNGRSK